ncbi:Metallo-hydrolase/oxidoreductase [Polyplosphaeria fusca]|uniref:Metallo-hydrolase/oxidoreductase n=1 Tax=Polyplosphaeria fusca TaxID=682080 RepID=A0A9P4V2I5_9PLEO|nr:Metallo-hydrolase/oxidoreductase [Polyplosphaeria fusca]
MRFLQKLIVAFVALPGRILAEFVCSNSHLSVHVYHESPTTVHYQGKDDLLYSPTAYTLIHSAHEAVLVDAPTLLADGASLAKWIAATAPGKKLKYIYITHAHADHFNSFPALTAMFPEAKVVTTQGVIEHMPAQYEGAIWDYFWKGLFPSIEKANLSVVEKLPSHGKFWIENSKFEFRAVSVGEGDTVDSTVLYVPHLDLVIGGDVVYGHCYQYIAENPTAKLRAQWKRSIDEIAMLRPKIVIPSHMQPQEGFGVKHLKETTGYIEEWEVMLESAETWEDLEGMAKKRWPDRVGTFILRYTAQSFFNATF